MALLRQDVRALRGELLQIAHVESAIRSFGQNPRADRCMTNLAFRICLAGRALSARGYAKALADCVTRWLVR